ncbi:MAG: ammonium transporter [Armatimonadetes bacterium]|nr:ammonium transporter [Akkermansiaceae bacterium]
MAVAFISFLLPATTLQAQGRADFRQNVEAAGAVPGTAENAPSTVNEALMAGPDAAMFAVNNLWILISAALVFLMHLGFCSVESGMCMKKNTANVLFKNVFIVSIGVLGYMAWGFNAMYPGWEAGVSNGFLAIGSPLTNGFDKEAVSAGNVIWADFLFQAMLAAIAVTIVSGAVAERMKLNSFMIFAAILVTFIYPITGSWKWGNGWLNSLGFEDFAGSTLIHAFGGFAALAAIMVLGPRNGKYTREGIVPILPHSLPLVNIGVFMMFLGWFGFNGGFVSSTDPEKLSRVFLTTTVSGFAGGISAIFASWSLLKKPDLSMALNGILAGLVGITAGADVISPWESVVVGAISGLLVVGSILFFDKIKIDDPVGAVSVHGVCGVFGTMAVAVFGGGKFFIQLLGTASVSLFAFFASFLLFILLKAVMGVRVGAQEELEGLDIAEHGSPAYNDSQIQG